ncbi:MAG TPA: PQQ-dependent sugar dehydrogenase [Gammaproteobacteria bacterium]|nr:PQQ-dependent sugar dehydrogenase [Gammaproteobacteria bacterium]
MNIRIAFSSAILCLAPTALPAQIGVPAMPLPDGPFVIDTAEQGPVRVTVMKGLELPWGMAFLPNGDLLVTERPARRLRIVRDGVLDPEPIAGLPEMSGGGGGLMSVAIHPEFADNNVVYVSYTKSAAQGNRAVGLSRGRLEGMALVDVHEIFAAEEPGGGPAPGLPLVFGPDGYLYFGIGGANDEIAQRGDSYFGKVLRLNDDGSVPENPFAGREGFHPELYTIGHRNMVGMTIHPETGAVWQNENGPLGGDEVNILKAGANYGWPLVSYGRDYSGAPVSDKRTMEGVEDPVLFWVPSIAISGMTFYTGEAFPAWRNNLFVGGLQFGRIARTGQMQRILFNESWQELRREAFFVGLRQRIRDVEQGPDDLLYVLTDEQDGALLRLEPADQAAERENLESE